MSETLFNGYPQAPTPLTGGEVLLGAASGEPGAANYNLTTGQVAALALSNASSGNVTATGSITARTLAAWFEDVANAKAFGAKGDGATDDTAAIQAAVSSVAANGGCVYFPPGNYLVSATIFISSNTTLMGDGPASLITATAGAWNNPTFTPTSDGYTPGNSVFCNATWSAMTLTDQNIKILYLAFNLQPPNSAVRKSAVSLHMMQNFEFAFNQTTGGGGVCEHVATYATNSHDNVFENFHSTASDHFSGFSYATVKDNFYAPSAAYATNPSIQFTGTNGNNTTNTSTGVICANNRIVGGAANVFCISVTAAGAGGVVNDVLIDGNAVNLNGITGGGGIGLYGGGDNWRINNNTIQGVSGYNCLDLVGNGYGSPNRAQVIGNRILDSSNTTGSEVILNVGGLANCSILDNDIINCTCLYPVMSTGNDCIVRNGRVDPGTGGSRGSVTGTNSFFIDPNITDGIVENSAVVQSAAGFKVGAGSVLGAYIANGTWTPNLTFGGASTGITYSTQTGTYLQIGKMIYINVVLVLTSAGTATGNAQITGAPGGSQLSGGTPRFGVAGASNMVSLTAEPAIEMSSLTIIMHTSTLTGAANLTNANFASNTALSFSGWYQVT